MRPYTVGTVMTENEARVITSDYDLDLPEPLKDMVIDAGGDEGAVCIAGKLNDPINIKRRYPGPPPESADAAGDASMCSQQSNGKGNSEYRCTDGAEANCVYITARCTGCSALPGGPEGLKHFHRLIYTTRNISSEGEPLLASYGRAWLITLDAHHGPLPNQQSS